MKKIICYNITNYVTANDCANIQLCLHASPVMSSEKREVDDFLRFADAVLINIGTVSKRDFQTMKVVMKHTRGIPIIFDPVGVGASRFRKKVAQSILNSNKVSIIKGNYKELRCIWEQFILKHPDSNPDTHDLVRTIADRYRCIVVMTGKEDLVSDGATIIKISGGSPLMPSITGTGCMLGAILTALGGYFPDHLLEVAILSSLIWKIVAEKSETKQRGLMHQNLFDQLATLKIGKDWRDYCEVL